MNIPNRYALIVALAAPLACASESGQGGKSQDATTETSASASDSASSGGATTAGPTSGSSVGATSSQTTTPSSSSTVGGSVDGNDGAGGGNGAGAGGAGGASSGAGGSGNGGSGNATTGGAGGNTSEGSGGAGGGENVGNGGAGGSLGSGGGGAVDEGAQGGGGGDDGMGGSGGEPEGMDPDEPSATSNPSPGCGAGERPNDGKVYVANESWLLFPESYDGSTPFPVLFGFHGCGGGNRGDASRTEYTDQTNGTEFESDYVRAVPLSADSGGCWNYNTDVGRVKAFYDELINNYCVDLDRIFATGHSSGAQFIQQTLTANRTADAEYFGFRAVAPVAASDYGAHGTAVPVMYIQGQNDRERGGNGKDAVDRFVAGNMCSTESMPYTAMGAGCQSDGTTVDPGCVSYDDCSVPTVWCSHNDPAYSGTSHGIPCFAAQATAEFFKSFD